MLLQALGRCTSTRCGGHCSELAPAPWRSRTPATQRSRASPPGCMLRRSPLACRTRSPQLVRCTSTCPRSPGGSAWAACGSSALPTWRSKASPLRHTTRRWPAGCCRCCWAAGRCTSIGPFRHAVESSWAPCRSKLRGRADCKVGPPPCNNDRWPPGSETFHCSLGPRRHTHSRRSPRGSSLGTNRSRIRRACRYSAGWGLPGQPPRHHRCRHRGLR
mmetsp:Transcript_78498/g.188236  ORF Transcript_78498/g.188236 Transcript_78498/m.188236 type:complete len:217 (-) Transcript_78498:225-875(-)